MPDRSICMLGFLILLAMAAFGQALNLILVP